MIAAIIQGRQGSARLPGKTLMELGKGRTTLGILIDNLRESRFLDDIIVACPTGEADDAIAEACIHYQTKVYRGDSEDVLARVIGAAEYYGVDVIVEITADCPMMDAKVVDQAIERYLDLEMDNVPTDMVTNFIPKTYPKGYEVRVFPYETLKKIEKQVDNPIDRQHVSTTAFWNPKFKRYYKIHNVEAEPPNRRPELAVTLDTPEDLVLMRALVGIAKECALPLTIGNVIQIIDTYPEYYKPAGAIVRKNYIDEVQGWYRENDRFKLSGKPPNRKKLRHYHHKENWRKEREK